VASVPKGTSDNPLTNKTEFMRYLDANADSVKPLRQLLAAYKAEPRNRGTFGYWMRNKKFADFNKAYASYWLKHPELYGTIYQ